MLQPSQLADITALSTDQQARHAPLADGGISMAMSNDVSRPSGRRGFCSSVRVKIGQTHIRGRGLLYGRRLEPS